MNINKKSLNKENKNKLFMNKIDKEDYKCLNACSEYTRAEIQVFKQKGQTDYSGKCPANVEQRLVAKGFINLKGRSEHMITDAGMKKLNQLEDRKWKFWTYFWSAVIGVCAFITLGRFIGWW